MPQTHHGVKGVRLAGLAALLGLVVAWSPASAEDTPAQEGGGDFILGAGDTLRVTVFDRPGLSGEAMIGPDGAVAWPLIGDIPAAGRSLRTVRADMTEAVERVLDHAPEVSVQVVGYRPIYVVGAVARPGEHAYMPGLSVLQAFAKAGGAPTLAGALAGRPFDQAGALLTARERLRQAVARERDQRLRRARLMAALAGEPTLTVPSELDAIEPAPGALDHVARWTEVLVAELPRLDAARETHSQYDALLGEEIAALTKEGTAIEAQLDVVTEEVRRMQALRNEGLTTNARMLSLRQIEADLQADRYRRDAALSRARQDRLREAHRLRDDEAEWRADRLEDLADLEADLVQTRIEVSAARERLAALGAASEIAIDDETWPDPNAMPQFVLLRRSPSGTMETMVAAPQDLMQPGDVLRVDQAPPPGHGQAWRSPTTLSLEVR